MKGPKPKLALGWADCNNHHTVCVVRIVSCSVTRVSLCVSMAALTVTGTALPRTSTSSITRFSGQRLSVLIYPKHSRRISTTISLASASNHNNNSTSASSSSSSGLYSAKTFELTAANVDLVLEDVRPYLLADGGNVDVVSVEDGVISLRLEGACETCPSSTTTMKMGIERVLKEKFGDAVKDIQQVSDADQPKETTVEVIIVFYFYLF